MLSPDLGRSISDFAAKLLGATPAGYSFEFSLVLRDKMLAKNLIFGFWPFGALQVLSRMIDRVSRVRFAMWCDYVES